ncbi:MAG: DUF1549 domain-containing protein [Gemmatimonadaceae bacterium]
MPAFEREQRVSPHARKRSDSAPKTHGGGEPGGLTPTGPADNRTLLRRVTFDLTGLPPTPEQRAAFEADTSPQAFAAVVDRLLAKARTARSDWGAAACLDDKDHDELERCLENLGLKSKLIRVEHHVAHQSNAFYASGYERALVVTIDAYGSGLSGSIAVGDLENGVRRLVAFDFLLTATLGAASGFTSGLSRFVLGVMNVLFQMTSEGIQHCSTQSRPGQSQAAGLSSPPPPPPPH